LEKLFGYCLGGIFRDSHRHAELPMSEFNEDAFVLKVDDPGDLFKRPKDILATGTRTSAACTM